MKSLITSNLHRDKTRTHYFCIVGWDNSSKQRGRASSNERNHLPFRVGRSSRSWRKPLTEQRSEEQRRVNDGGNVTHRGGFSPFTIRQWNIPRGVSPFESLSRDPTRRGKDLTEAWLGRRCSSRSRCIITAMIISNERWFRAITPTKGRDWRLFAWYSVRHETSKRHANGQFVREEFRGNPNTFQRVNHRIT